MQRRSEQRVRQSASSCGRGTRETGTDRIITAAVWKIISLHCLLTASQAHRNIRLEHILLHWSNMDIRYLRVYQILGCRKRGIDPIIPVSRSTWWAGVKSGRFPKGRLLGPRTRVWDAAEIRALVVEG